MHCSEKTLFHELLKIYKLAPVGYYYQLDRTRNVCDMYIAYLPMTVICCVTQGCSQKGLILCDIYLCTKTSIITNTKLCPVNVIIMALH